MSEVSVDPRYHRHGVGDIIWDKEDDTPVVRYAVCRICEQAWEISEYGWKPQKPTAKPKFTPKRKNEKKESGAEESPEFD